MRSANDVSRSTLRNDPCGPLPRLNQHCVPIPGHHHQNMIAETVMKRPSVRRPNCIRGYRMRTSHHCRGGHSLLARNDHRHRAAPMTPTTFQDRIATPVHDLVRRLQAAAPNQERFRLDPPFSRFVVSFGPEHSTRFRVSCPTVKSPAPRTNITSPTFTAIIGSPGLRIRMASNPRTQTPTGTARSISHMPLIQATILVSCISRTLRTRLAERH